MGCSLLCSAAFSANVLIKNGNFENQLEGWEVPSWIKNAAPLILDNKDMPGPGAASLKLVAENGKLPILYQKIKFLPGVKQYKISFKVKTEKISNWGFFIVYVTGDKLKKRCFEKVVGAGHGVRNSTPWTTYDGIINVPEEAFGQTGKLSIQFGSKVTGTAWIDDITIEPITTENKDNDKPAPAQAEAGKKKINPFILNAVDSDLNLMRSHWEIISWLPNADFQGEPKLDYQGTVPADKVLAFMQRCMSVHTNCDGPFRFSAWLKVAEAASPYIAISTFPQNSTDKSAYKTFVIRPTGKFQDGFAEYAGDFTAPNKTAELRVSLRTLKPQKSPLTIAIKDSKLRPIVIPGEKIELFHTINGGKQGVFLSNETPQTELIFRNQTAKSETLSMQCTVYNYFGEKVKEFPCKFILPPLSFTRCPIKVEGLKENGFYAVECNYKAGQAAGKTDFSIIKVSAPPKNPDRAFGITFVADTNARNAQAMNRIGFGTKGVRIAWREVERPDGTYSWSAVDAAVKACLDNNVKIIGGFEIFSDHVPKKYLDAKKKRNGKTVDTTFDQAYFDAALKFELAAQKRYQKYISEWTYMSEIDLLKGVYPYEADHYVKRIRNAAPHLRKQQPEMILTAIGCSGVDGRNLPRFKTMRMLWAQLHDVLDGVAPDQYTMPSTFGPGNQPVDSESGLLREIMLEAHKIITADGKNVLAIDEKGPHIVYNLPMNNEYARNMANIVVRDYIIVKSLPVKYWLYYGWNRWRDGSELDYGLWKKASPRHTVSAIAATARTLNNAVFVKKADLHKSVPVYIFKKGSKTIAVLWRSGNGKDISILTELPKDTVLVNVEGRETAITGKKNTLTLTDAPIYIVSDSAPEVVEKCLKNASMSLPELQAAMSMISRNKVAVYINNLTSSVLTASCTVNGKNEKKITLQAQSVKDIVIPFEPSDKEAVLEIKTAKGFTYTIKEKFENIPVKRTKSMADLKKSAPTFILDKTELHLNNVDFAANKHYTGADDCSVIVRMGYDKSNLYMNVKVKDDIHVNEQTRDFMTWAGDCIQFGFDPNRDAKLKNMQGKSAFCDDDLLFTAALVGEEQRFLCHNAPDIKKIKPDYTVKRDENNKTTEFDITIPLNQIPSLKTVPGTVFGFNLIALDCDVKGGTSQYWMQLSPGIAAGQNTTLFKGFIFE